MLDSESIVEITPLVSLKPATEAPDGIAGFLEYRGRDVPVVDVSLLLSGVPCNKHYSTRIILTHIAEQRLIGLMVEHATEMVRNQEPNGNLLTDQIFSGPLRKFLMEHTN